MTVKGLSFVNSIFRLPSVQTSRQFVMVTAYLSKYSIRTKTMLLFVVILRIEKVLCTLTVTKKTVSRLKGSDSICKSDTTESESLYVI